MLFEISKNIPHGIGFNLLLLSSSFNIYLSITFVPLISTIFVEFLLEWGSFSFLSKIKSDFFELGKDQLNDRIYSFY